jgi:hypothetical protein
MLIELISGDGWCGPPFLVVRAKMHLASWYTEGGLPNDWVIETSPNRWTSDRHGSHTNKKRVLFVSCRGKYDHQAQWWRAPFPYR